MISKQFLRWYMETKNTECWAGVLSLSCCSISTYQAASCQRSVFHSLKHQFHCPLTANSNSFANSLPMANLQESCSLCWVFCRSSPAPDVLPHHARPQPGLERGPVRWRPLHQGLWLGSESRSGFNTLGRWHRQWRYLWGMWTICNILSVKFTLKQWRMKAVGSMVMLYMPLCHANKNFAYSE